MFCKGLSFVEKLLCSSSFPSILIENQFLAKTQGKIYFPKTSWKLRQILIHECFGIHTGLNFRFWKFLTLSIVFFEKYFFIDFQESVAFQLSLHEKNRSLIVNSCCETQNVFNILQNTFRHKTGWFSSRLQGISGEQVQFRVFELVFAYSRLRSAKSLVMKFTCFFIV